MTKYGVKPKKMVLGAWSLVLGAWCLVLGAGTAHACTGMYAGKKVTTDGSVLIGRTVDFSPYNATMRQQICERGAQVSFGDKVNNYRYVCAPKATSLCAGRYAGSAVNEKGVILTMAVKGHPNAYSRD